VEAAATNVEADTTNLETAAKKTKQYLPGNNIGFMLNF
jgi:hypothetical protein